MQAIYSGGEEKINWRGVNIKVNPGEVHGYYPYFLGDYSREEIEKLIELCREANLFADVGANIGLMSLALARACPELEIYAFEPEQDTIRRFCKNLSLNPDLLARVHLIENAVSEVNGNLPFQPSSDVEDAEIGRLADEEILTQIAYSVPSVRLDTFFETIGKYPDVVKIDVEGSELGVLKGMNGLFSLGYPIAMIIEVHSFYFDEEASTFKAEIKGILEKTGYDLFALEGRGWKRLAPPAEWPGRLHILATKKW